MKIAKRKELLHLKPVIEKVCLKPFPVHMPIDKLYQIEDDIYMFYFKSISSKYKTMDALQMSQQRIRTAWMNNNYLGFAQFIVKRLEEVKTYKDI